MSSTSIPHQPDFATITCTSEIASSIELAWSHIGGYADAGQFLNVTSILISGDGRLGSVRQIAESILEVMVGASDFSYTYAQVRGPMSQYGYHGCVSLSPSEPEKCKLTYTLIYDQASMSVEEQRTQFERVSDRFNGAARAMKQVVELSKR